MGTLPAISSDVTVAADAHTGSTQSPGIAILRVSLAAIAGLTPRPLLWPSLARRAYAGAAEQVLRPAAKGAHHQGRDALSRPGKLGG